MDVIFFIGRLLFGTFLLYNSYNHLRNTDALTAYAESKKIPQARYGVIFTGLLLLFGAYTILAGVRVSWGVAALVLFFLPVTFFMHPFWKETGQERAQDQVNFMKNIAILGAILMFLAIPTPWPLSIG